MPFISEYLYHELNATNLESGDSIMVMKFPTPQEQDKKIEKRFSLIMEAIVSIRRAKATLDLPTSAVNEVFIKLNSDIDLTSGVKYISKLTKVETINFVDKKIENSAGDVSDNLEVYISLDGIDLTPIIKRLQAQKEKLSKEIGKLNGMLNNEKFVANAPEDVLAKNRELLESATSKLQKVDSELSSLV
jgi:valyl-tRNA synthetase